MIVMENNMGEDNENVYNNKKNIYKNSCDVN